MKRKNRILLAAILCAAILAGIGAFLLRERPSTLVVYGTVTEIVNDSLFRMDIEEAENAENVHLDAKKASVVWERSSEFEVGDRVKVVTDGTQPLGPYNPNPETRTTAFYALDVKKLWWPW